MFFNKLRLVIPALQRNSILNATTRATRLNFPSIASAVRTYSRFIDDDEDDMPVTSRKRFTDSNNERKPFQSQRNSEQKFGRFNGGSSYQPKRFGSEPRNNQRFGGESREYEYKPFGNSRFGGSRFPSSNRDQGFGSSLGSIDWSAEQLEEIKKDFYQPSEITQNRSEDEIRDFQKEFEITVQQNAPKPIFTFNELKNLPQSVMNVIEKQGFSECTPIQAHGMPIALSGQNLVGIAQTGYVFNLYMTLNGGI